MRVLLEWWLGLVKMKKMQCFGDFVANLAKGRLGNERADNQ